MLFILSLHQSLRSGYQIHFVEYAHVFFNLGTGILLLLIKRMLFPFFSFYHFIKAYIVVTRFILWSTHMFFLNLGTVH